MASPAKRLEAVRIVGVLPRFALQRGNVVTLQASGPAALDTTPAIAFEDGAADSGPVPGIQVGVVSAHVLLCDSSFPRGRRGAVVSSALMVARLAA